MSFGHATRTGTLRECTVDLFYQSVCAKWMVVTNVASCLAIRATGITIIDFVGLLKVPTQPWRFLNHLALVMDLQSLLFGGVFVISRCLS